MRLGIGAMLFEGNTFSPVVTGRDAFEARYLHAGPAVVDALRGTNTEAAGAIGICRERAVDFVPLLATNGGSGGRVAASCYAELKADLLSRLSAASPLDGLYLALHGAFVAEGVDDVESDLLRSVRAIVGGIPLVVSCDMHAHITLPMLELCDALVGYQLYPHDDTAETGERAMRLLVDITSGRVRPVMRACRAPMLAPAQKQRTAGAGPMARIFALARNLEGDGVHAVSYFCVQPWMDLPAMGFTAVVVAEDATTAEAHARRIAETAWAAREDFLVEVHAPTDAIAAGLRIEGQIVLADAADCVGGGAPGSSAEVLRALLDHAPQAPAAIHLVAPWTVEAARNKSLGEEVEAVFPDAAGKPFSVPARLVSASDGRFTYRSGPMGGVAVSMGPSIVLRVGAVDVLVASQSAYEYADEAFLANGIDPAVKKFVVVKNPMNYQAAYPKAAAFYVLDTPGPTTPNLAALPWRHVDRPTFPIDRAFPPDFVVFPGGEAT
ncbi:MAG: M81 family metallopeptidase [Parvibaculaceae bacterium]